MSIKAAVCTLLHQKGRIGKVAVLTLTFFVLQYGQTDNFLFNLFFLFVRNLVGTFVYCLKCSLIS